MQSPITHYRKTNDQTLEALADVLGVDKSTIWRWERGKIPVDRLADVERATGIPRQSLRPDIFGDAQ
jgi:transcriptional regulator with XRE-family HTH domain